MDLTQIIQKAQNGDSDARADLIQTAYDDLRRLATAKMSDERLDHTLTSTALVHEVSMKMLSDSELPVANRGQFFAYASKAMRNYLIDHARTKCRQKRGGNRSKFSFDEAIVACQEQSEEFLELNAALDSLAEINPRKAQLVEMRYYGGMSNQEIAAALDISVATVKRDWTVAKTWLLNRLRRNNDSPSEAGV